MVQLLNRYAPRLGVIRCANHGMIHSVGKNKEQLRTAEKGILIKPIFSMGDEYAMRV